MKQVLLFFMGLYAISINSQQIGNCPPNLSNYYTVEYDSCGGSSVENQDNVEEGELISMPTYQTRPGYEFAGWYTDLTFSSAWEFSKNAVISDMTLYALWIEEFNIYFDVNRGATANPCVKDVVPGNIIGTLADAVKEGYKLIGWNTSADGSGMMYSENDIYNAEGTLILYAMWEEMHILSFDPAGGTSVKPVCKYLSQGDQVGKLPMTCKESHRFLGWNTNDDGSGTMFSADMVYEYDSNITLYAIWEPLYVVTFDANGGVLNGNKDISIAHGEIVGKLPLVTRDGFTFLEWNSQSDGKGITYYAESIYEVFENTILYAIWENSISTGSQNSENTKLELYPNPFVSEINIKGAKGGILSVKNLSGLEIYNQSVNNAQETIQLGNLPAGIYFFQIQIDGKSFMMKGTKK